MASRFGTVSCWFLSLCLTLTRPLLLMLRALFHSARRCGGPVRPLSVRPNIYVYLSAPEEYMFPRWLWHSARSFWGGALFHCVGLCVCVCVLGVQVSVCRTRQRASAGCRDPAGLRAWASTRCSSFTGYAACTYICFLQADIVYTHTHIYIYIYNIYYIIYIQ